MEGIKLAICHKNFKKIPGVSHVGLGVSAANNVKILQENNINVEVKILDSDLDFLHFLRKARKEENPYTHIVISALWARTGVLNELCAMFQDTIFAVNCHSNVGFLQAEPAAIKLIREQLKLQDKHKNFHIAGNSKKFVNFIKHGYGDSCVYLPNMYSLSHVQRPGRTHLWNGEELCLGMFGAPRVQKNFISGAAVAIEMHKQLKPTKTILSMNCGRNDTSDTARLITGIEELTKDIVGFELNKIEWCDWFEFNKIVSQQNLLLQPSYSETFNIVCGDGVANNIASLVSPAIDWAPNSWKANSDDIEEMTKIATRLLFDRKAAMNGYDALQRHNKESLGYWLKFLGLEKGNDWFGF